MPSIYRPDRVVGPQADAAHGAQIDTHAPDAQGAAADGQPDWAGRRKAQPANVLLPATRRWLESLPVEVRPLTLAKQFARLANLVAANWANPADCSAFLYSLVHDQRGGRRGFPHEVMEDIVKLRIYYARLHPIVDWETSADGERHRRR